MSCFQSGQDRVRDSLPFLIAVLVLKDHHDFQGRSRLSLESEGPHRSRSPLSPLSRWGRRKPLWLWSRRLALAAWSDFEQFRADPWKGHVSLDQHLARNALRFEEKADQQIPRIDLFALIRPRVFEGMLDDALHPRCWHDLVGFHSLVARGLRHQVGNGPACLVERDPKNP